MKTLSVAKVLAMPQYPNADTLYFTKKENTLNAVLPDTSQNHPAVANRSVILLGPKEIYLDYNAQTGYSVSPVQYTIDNYDSFTTYQVRVSNGTVSILGDVITVTPVAAESNLYIGVNGEFSKIKVRKRGVNQPLITYPHILDTKVNSTFEVHLSAFDSLNIGETCTKTEVQLSIDADFSNILDTLSYAGPSTNMTANLSRSHDSVYIRARHTGSITGPGPWSEIIRVIVFASLSAPLKETFEFTASNTLPNDAYGATIAISGKKECLAISAMYRDSGKGAVYVYSGAGDFWDLDVVLQPTDLPEDAMFGKAVAISKNGLVLAISSTSTSSRVGSVYIYARDNTEWKFIQKIIPTSSNFNDGFGDSLSLSNDGVYLSIGSIGDDDTVGDSGAVYVYKVGNLIWELKQKLKSPTPAAGNKYGYQSCLSGDGLYLTISEIYGDVGTSNIGIVYIYTRSGETWALQASLYESQLGANKRYGAGLAINETGTVILIGAPDQNSGIAFSYLRSGSTWSKKSTITQPSLTAGSKFGEAVAVSSDGLKAAIGAYAAYGSQGTAYLYQGTEGNYVEQQELINIMPETYEWFGYSVVITDAGKAVICGSPEGRGHKGAVNIFN